MKSMIVGGQVLALFLASLISSTALAQFLGQGTAVVVPEAVFPEKQSKVEKAAMSIDMQVITVADILKNPLHELPVRLQGKLSRKPSQKLPKKRYEFSDNTGSIRMKIDEEDITPESINKNVLVEVHGTIDKKRSGVIEIDADRIHVISKK